MTERPLYERALIRFNSILDQGENHNDLILLRKDGWTELCPSEGYLVFQHPDYPDVTITWYNHNQYGTTYNNEGSAVYFATSRTEPRQANT